MAEKKSDFVVTDRRKFTYEGERREEATLEPEKAPEIAAAVQPETAPVQSQPPNVPPPPSAADQQAQSDAYAESRKQFEPSPLSGRSAKEFEMNFERLVASLYMTAMMQMGLMREVGAQPMIDVLGARQTIDTLALLNEKTKGNLTDTEQNLLQNCLYELRMAFVEITNMIARGPDPNATPPEKK